jgi:hypothetical protein
MQADGQGETIQRCMQMDKEGLYSDIWTRRAYIAMQADGQRGPWRMECQARVPSRGVPQAHQRINLHHCDSGSASISASADQPSSVHQRISLHQCDSGSASISASADQSPSVHQRISLHQCISGSAFISASADQPPSVHQRISLHQCISGSAFISASADQPSSVHQRISLHQCALRALNHDDTQPRASDSWSGACGPLNRTTVWRINQWDVAHGMHRGM